MFGRCGEGKGDLKWPFGVGIDSSDKVYVTESGNRCVSVFTTEGQFVTSFGTWSKGLQMAKAHPLGLAVDNTGVVYVCDGNRVKLF